MYTKHNIRQRQIRESFTRKRNKERVENGLSPADPFLPKSKSPEHLSSPATTSSAAAANQIPNHPLSFSFLFCLSLKLLETKTRTIEREREAVSSSRYLGFVLQWPLLRECYRYCYVLLLPPLPLPPPTVPLAGAMTKIPLFRKMYSLTIPLYIEGRFRVITDEGVQCGSLSLPVKKPPPLLSLRGKRQTGWSQALRIHNYMYLYFVFTHRNSQYPFCYFFFFKSYIFKIFRGYRRGESTNDFEDSSSW